MKDEDYFSYVKVGCMLQSPWKTLSSPRNWTGSKSARVLSTPSVVWIIEEGQECPVPHSSRCSQRWAWACHLAALQAIVWRKAPTWMLWSNLAGEDGWHPSVDTGCASDVSTIWSPQKMLVQLLWEGWEWYLRTQGQEPDCFWGMAWWLWLIGEIEA